MSCKWPRCNEKSTLTRSATATRADSTKPESPDMVSAAFAERLRKMGVVQPNPTYSPSSTAVPFPDVPDQYPPAPNYPPATSNVTLGVLEARRQLQERADLELENRGKSTDRGRELLDIETIRKILVLRQRGERSADIEARLRLRSGVVDRLGPLGLVTALATQAA